MQVLRAFEKEEAKVTRKVSKFIAICKDALLATETLTSKVECIKKHCRAHEIAL